MPEIMGHEEYHRRLREIAEAAASATRAEGTYSDIRFGDQGHVALFLLSELARLLAERAADDIPDGR